MKTYIAKLLREIDNDSRVVSTHGQYLGLVANGESLKKRRYLSSIGKFPLFADNNDFSDSIFEAIQFIWIKYGDMKHVDLSNCVFERTIFSAKSWNECEFQNSTFENADTMSQFIHCDFDGAFFYASEPRDEPTEFINCHMNDAQFRGQISNIKIRNSKHDSLLFDGEDIKGITIGSNCTLKNCSFMTTGTLDDVGFVEAELYGVRVHAQNVLNLMSFNSSFKNFKLHCESKMLSDARSGGNDFHRNNFEDFEFSSPEISDYVFFNNFMKNGIFTANKFSSGAITRNEMENVDFSGVHFDYCGMLYNKYHNCKFDNCTFEQCSFYHDTNAADKKIYTFEGCSVNGARFVGCKIDQYTKDRLLENGATIED